ncbi:hypothetical protein RchiOBHm_Chr7g0192171 [Rosa chinensis]|uniref:Uncharacterized protein n=1 Tax=Rosa chinensis TaxID=74649 RepID=A0A2P6P5K3_ROSCH|nr:hypothetical protein RchiOBHm_Chr7g0192171 [Rosa chinensis]
MRATVSRMLHQEVDDICQQRGTTGLFADLMEDFVNASDFMDYLEATWYPRICLGCRSLANHTVAYEII